MISVRPLTSRIAKRLYRADLSAAAERTIDLSEPVRRQVELPIMLPGEPDRIKQHHRCSNPKMNMERLTNRIVTEGSTRLHLLKDVLIGDGCVMSRRYFERLARIRRRLLLRGEPEEVRESVLCTSYFTEKYFGHWLREGLAFEQLADDVGLPSLVLERAPWTHEPSYRNLVAMHPNVTRLARCASLWVPEDPRYNFHFGDRHRRVGEPLRNAVAAPAQPSSKVYISRGRTAQGRTLANDDEVRSALARYGFEVLEPESLSASNIASALSRARLVVSPEGSALAHATLAMAPGTAIIAIIGAQHFTTNYKGICDVLGLRFGFTIADALDAERFHQPLSRLLQTIDLVEAAVERDPMTGSIDAQSTADITNTRAATGVSANRLPPPKRARASGGMSARHTVKTA